MSYANYTYSSVLNSFMFLFAYILKNEFKHVGEARGCSSKQKMICVLFGITRFRRLLLLLSVNYVVCYENCSFFIRKLNPTRHDWTQCASSCGQTYNSMERQKVSYTTIVHNYTQITVRISLVSIPFSMSTLGLYRSRNYLPSHSSV